MSRTYKDQPDWVKAKKTGKVKIRHHARCEDNPHGWQFESTRREKITREAHWHLEKIDYSEFFGTDHGLKWVYSTTVEEVTVPYVIGRDRPCDLDTKHNSGRRCKFYYDPDERYCPYSCCNPGPDDVRDCYYTPERRYTRGTLREAVKDYNTNGDTDIEPLYANSNPHGPWVAGYWG